jgi:hypothetical protein
MKATFALVSSLAFATGAVADGVENLIPLYNPYQMKWLLNDQNVKSELRISRDQEKGIQATLKKWDQLTSKDNDTKFKMTGPDKFAQTRALDTRRGEQLLQMLSSVLGTGQVNRLKQIVAQSLGMRLFNHPEIRDALGLSAAKVAELHAIYKQLRDQPAKDFLDKKISREEGQKRYSSIGNVVPEEVRAALSDQQRRTLEDILGPVYRSR